MTDKDACQVSNIYHVFVYGTLKGMDHGWRDVGNIHKVGIARTKEAYVLYNGGFPKCVDETQVNLECKGHVLGELHTVDESALDALDVYEGHPHHFTRKEIEIELDDIGVVKAWMYFGPASSHLHNDPIPPKDGLVTWPHRPEPL